MMDDAAARHKRHLRRARRFALLERLVVPVAIPIVRLWAATWRLRVDGEDHFRALLDQPGPRAVATLHGDLALLVGAAMRHRPDGQPLTILSSPSRDGQLMARAYARIGFQSITGSSSKRATESLRALVRACAGGAPVLLTVDGPRGPRGVPHAGVLLVARQARARLTTVVLHARPALRLRTWDRLAIPAPFARVTLRARLLHDHAEGPFPGDERAALQAQLLDGVDALGGDTAGIERLSPTTTKAPRPC